jgi:hypothetical protein
VKRWAESSLSGLGALTALIVCSEAAKAGSRFETTPIQSTKASAQLDFTIVIPEAIYVGSPWGTGEKNTPKPLAARGPDGIKPGEPYVVLTNGGTLAFAPASVGLVQSAEMGSQREPSETPLSRAFLVAMP